MASTLVRKLLLQINADSADAETKLELIKEQADELRDKHPELKVKLDTAEAQAKMAVLREEFRKSIKVKVEPDVSMFRTVLDRLAMLGGSRGAGTSWRALAGLLPGVAAPGAEAGTEGAGGILPFLASPMGAGAMGAGAFALSPLISSLLGGGVGLGGALGAFKIGSDAHTNLLALQATLASAEKTLAGASTANTRSAAATRAKDQAAVAADQAKVTAYENKNSASLGVYNDISGIGKALESTFMGSLTSGGKNSFISGLAADLKGIAPFIRTLEPELAKMFQSSLPFVKMFVTAMERFAGEAIPAITAAMEHLKPYMPMMQRFFDSIAVAIGGVIRAIGWMSGAFVNGIRITNTVVQAFWSTVRATFDATVRGVGDFADAWRRNFDRMTTDLKHWTDDVSQFIGRMVHDVAGLWDRFGHDMANWAQVVDNIIGNVITWFKNLPGNILRGVGNLGNLLYQGGKDVVSGLIRGVESMFGAVAHTAESLVSSLGHSVLHLLGIGSPSKVAHYWGQMVGQGLAGGLDDSHSAVSSSARRLAGATLAMPAGGYGGGYGAAAGAGLRVQIDVTGADPALRTWLKRSIRVTGGDPGVIGR